jgi:L,D-transpeptidase catalytic domain/Sporulation and spore germination/Putative peptidoglycan binding domain
MRLLLVTLLLAVAGTLALDLEPSAAQRAEAARARVEVAKPVVAAPQTVEVAFVREGRLVRVERVVPKGVPPRMHALKELTQGPTRAERARGFRTAMRPDVRLRSLRSEHGMWLASFSRSLFGPGTVETVRTRLAQITWTLSRLGGPQEYAAISAEGRLATVLRLGVRHGAWRAQKGEKGYLYSARGVQLRLWQLGYLSRADVSGSLDYATSQSLLAFQGWEGLSRTGTVTGETQVALLNAGRPRPGRRGAGRRVEIHLDLGVLLLVEGDEVLRAVHTSTGAGGATPSGSFRVYRKELYSWSVPFRVWMPYAAYFVGGIATHEYSHVPEYPASHGCVRLPEGDAARVYRFVEVGTPVQVF